MIPAAVQADAAAQPTHPPLDAGSKPEPSAEPRGPLLGYPRWWGLPGVRDDEAPDLRLLRHGLVGGRIDPAVGCQQAWGLAQALLVCRETVWHRGEILACLGADPVAADNTPFHLRQPDLAAGLHRFARLAPDDDLRVPSGSRCPWVASSRVLSVHQRLYGETGRVLWQYHADAQVQAALVPTKSGLLFAGDTHGNLLALDAQSGAVLKRIDVQGALNHGLISYAVGGTQYVAAADAAPLPWLAGGEGGADARRRPEDGDRQAWPAPGPELRTARGAADRRHAGMAGDLFSPHAPKMS
jgi:PQQ-like domain